MAAAGVFADVIGIRGQPPPAAQPAVAPGVANAA
jgi:hypothetical protein